MDELKENIDYVVCQVCGFKGKRITHKHLFNLHNLTLSSYREQFPGFKTTSDKSKELTNWSQDVRDRISKTMTGRKLSSEHIEHLKGRPCSPELRKKISDAQIGKYVSEETKQKIRTTRAKQINTRKGVPQPKEAIEKQKLSMKKLYASGYVHPNKGRKYSTERRNQISNAVTLEMQKPERRALQSLFARQRFMINNSVLSIGKNENNLLDKQEIIDNVKILRQYKLIDLGYTVDGYCLETNTVYEVYERFHARQVMRDIQRQWNICEYLNCHFTIIYDRN